MRSIVLCAVLVVCALGNKEQFHVIKANETWEQRFDVDLVEQLAQIGPLADIGEWSVLPHNAQLPDELCADLRLKVWIVVHLPEQTYAQDSFAHITALRLDGVGESPDLKSKHFRCAQEKNRLWQGAAGWPAPLLVVLCPGTGTTTSTLAALDPNARKPDMMDNPKVPHPRAPNCVTIDLPATGTVLGGPDVLRMRVRVPGLRPVPLKSTRIPRRIVQVTQDSHREGSAPSSIVVRLTATMRIMNPGFEYFDVAADELVDKVQALGGRSARATLESLQPIAYRVDYFRALELLHHGGVYADSKLVPLFPFDSLLPEEGALFPMDMKPARVWNGLIAFPPGDPLLVAAVAEIEENVKYRYYGRDSLEPTGPASFYRAWMHANIHRSSLGEPKYTHDFMLGTHGLFIQSLQTGAPIMIVHNVEYRRLHSWTNPCFYGRLHRWGAVYNEVHCDPEHGLPWYSLMFYISSKIPWWGWRVAVFCLLMLVLRRMILRRAGDAAGWIAIPQI